MKIINKTPRFIFCSTLIMITLMTSAIVLPLAAIGRAMKFFLILILVSVALTSCKKEQDLAPKQQVVSYHIECEYCLIYFEDNVWNHLNELERSRNQYLNISGTWDYSFTNTKLDSLAVKFYVGPLGAPQTIKGFIATTDNRKLLINENMGGDHGTEKTFTLALKD